VTLSDPTDSQPSFTAPSNPAVLTFTLTVTDSLGLADSTPDEVTVTVSDSPITGLAATNSSPTVLGNATIFTATITGGSNTSYSWNFGDGNTSSGATPTHTYGSAGTYTVVVTASNSLDLLTATTIVTVTGKSGSDISYFPMIAKNSSSGPDLVVERLDAGSSGVVVVIKNIGNTPVTDAFWVDVYLNPASPPTQVNQRWQDVGDQGLVWGIQGAALPLEPGESLTLTMGDAYFFANLSNFSTPLPAGSPVYAQVDSVNSLTGYGGVLESHEISGGPYNNILQAVSAAGLNPAVRGAEASPAGAAGLPPR
jgi:PKD repeat protein